MHRLAVKSQATPPMRASKWLVNHVLMDAEEMQLLLRDLGEFWMFPLGGVIPVDKECISPSEFIEVYAEYVDSLKNGRQPVESTFRRCLTSAWTVSLDCLYTVPLSTGKEELIKIEKPVIQLQHHTMDYSSADGKFRSMVFGAGTVSWGVQFSYPQLYQDRALETHQVKENTNFPNTNFFKSLQRWIRVHTMPTPFLVGDNKINSSIRLGKNCFQWINQHPQLSDKGIRVAIYN